MRIANFVFSDTPYVYPVKYLIEAENISPENFELEKEEIEYLNQRISSQAPIRKTSVVQKEAKKEFLHNLFLMVCKCSVHKEKVKTLALIKFSVSDETWDSFVNNASQKHFKVEVYSKSIEKVKKEDIPNFRKQRADLIADEIAIQILY